MIGPGVRRGLAGASIEPLSTAANDLYVFFCTLLQVANDLQQISNADLADSADAASGGYAINADKHR